MGEGRALIRYEGPVKQTDGILENIVTIERLGGFAGFGGRLRSIGSLPAAALTPAEREALDALFQRGGSAAAAAGADAFRYRITRRGPLGEESIETQEREVPPMLMKSLSPPML